MLASSLTAVVLADRLATVVLASSLTAVALAELLMHLTRARRNSVRASVVLGAAMSSRTAHVTSTTMCW